MGARGGRVFCHALESQRDVYLSGHELPKLQLPFTQTLPTADNPVVEILSSAQTEANNVARFNHEVAIGKYWDDCYAYLSVLAQVFLHTFRSIIQIHVLDSNCLCMRIQWAGMSPTA